MSGPEHPLSPPPVWNKDGVAPPPLRRRSAPSVMPASVLKHPALERHDAHESPSGQQEAPVPTTILIQGSGPQEAIVQPDSITSIAAPHHMGPKAFFRAYASHLEAIQAPAIHFNTWIEAEKFYTGGESRRWDPKSVTTFDGRPRTNDECKLYLRRLILAMISQENTLDSPAQAQRFADFLLKKDSQKTIEMAAWRVIHEMVVYHFIRGGPGSAPVDNGGNVFKGAWSLHFDTLCQLFEKHKSQVFACMGNAADALKLTVAEPAFRIERVLRNLENNTARQQRFAAIKRKAEAVGAQHAGFDAEQGANDKNTMGETGVQQQNQHPDTHMSKRNRIWPEQRQNRENSTFANQVGYQSYNDDELRPRNVPQLDGHVGGNDFPRAVLEPAFDPFRHQQPAYLEAFGHARSPVNAPPPARWRPQGSLFNQHAPVPTLQPVQNRAMPTVLAPRMQSSGYGNGLQPNPGNLPGPDPATGGSNTRRPTHGQGNGQ